jgi:hypothetical protein
VVCAAGAAALVEKKLHVNTRRQPPRRESIEDHIATACAFLARSGVSAGASRAWVRDLVYKGIIDGPLSQPKTAGRGRLERFSAPNYRDLIEGMRVRAEGAIHRSTWRLWLWSRGRDYPIDEIRRAMTADLRRNLNVVRAQLAPTGRYTEPFTVKYRRNVAPQAADSPFPDLGPLAIHSRP